ncbi:MAG: hypothetical protein ACFFFH_00965 [Candidatus Thorarchaeota archaeon]
MSTFLVIVDALISSSQKRFSAIEHKLNEFKDLLLGASVKGLLGLFVATKKGPIKEVIQPVQQSISRLTSETVTSPPPHPPEEKSFETISEDMEVEDLAALAFKQREREATPPSRPPPARFGAVSLKMELFRD